MKLKLALLPLLLITACKTSPPPTPTTLALCAETNVITFHAPLDFDPNAPAQTWPDTTDNVFDTPESVRRIMIHNARYRALCGS